MIARSELGENVFGWVEEYSEIRETESKRDIGECSTRGACKRARDVRDGFQYQIEFRGSLIFNLLASTLTIYHRYTRDPRTIVKSFQNFLPIYNRRDFS